ncbi:thioesterase II family protein [Prauserella endophytica]|uniref:Thioesterase n=1 Tax=Prauserella endophytica TaxID=1592324 RepID=A0ABY2RVK6_9PSEU|nr:thioesterase domain-containing protein [Prauserella endophytica]TKG60506.1 thioesterase [Prauserella endophytica]
MTVNLFCFHHAGGTASVFRAWEHGLPDGFTLRPVQLPGRDNPATAVRYHDLRPLVEDLDELLDADLAEPYATFGHSMGALIAYWLVQRRMARGATLPLAYLVAAYAAPHLTRPRLVGENVQDLDDVTLAHRLRAVGGMPEELLSRPEWLRLLLGTVRDDLILCASHRYIAAPKLPMPVYVFGGRRDPLVDIGQLGGWRDHAADVFGIDLLDGGHFLVQDRNSGLLPAVRARLVEAVPTVRSHPLSQ